MINILRVRDNQREVPVSNEIFNQINTLLNNKAIKKAHVSFIYCYLYYVSYMTRYAKYNETVPSVKDIKSLLGISELNKGYDYIIKNGGILDRYSITASSRDYFIGYDEHLNFKRLSDCDEKTRKEYRKKHGLLGSQSFKYPILAFNKQLNATNKLSNTGYYYNKDLRFTIDIRVFLFCLDRKRDLGLEGFFLYSYHSFNKTSVSADNSELEIFLNSHSLTKYYKNLRKYNMIQSRLEYGDKRYFYHSTLKYEDFNKSLGNSEITYGDAIKEYNIFNTNSELFSILANPEDGYKYTCNSNKKVNWKCLNCGEIIVNKRINLVNYRGLSCPRCSLKRPYPERMMYILLSTFFKNIIVDESQEWSKQKRYDFYMPNFKMITETHGMQHSGYGYEGLSGRTLEEEQANDKLKYEMAIANGIEHYIVIDCRYSKFNYIKKNILESELNNLLNLSNVDWESIEKELNSQLAIKY